MRGPRARTAPPASSRRGSSVGAAPAKRHPARAPPGGPGGVPTPGSDGCGAASDVRRWQSWTHRRTEVSPPSAPRGPVSACRGSGRRPVGLVVALAVVEPDRAHPARVIRPAVPEDRGAIVAFCRTTWGGENSDYIERVIDDWLTRDDGALAVAAIDGRAVGCAHVRLLSPHEAFVAGMRVHPAHRRSGLSVALTDYCLRYAADHGRSTARVIIGWNNAAALGAIARAGFRRVASMTLWERAVEPAAPAPAGGGGDRSEERRVGKECRSRWGPDQEKKEEEKEGVRTA